MKVSNVLDCSSTLILCGVIMSAARCSYCLGFLVQQFFEFCFVFWFILVMLRNVATFT